VIHILCLEELFCDSARCMGVSAMERTGLQKHIARRAKRRVTTAPVMVAAIRIGASGLLELKKPEGFRRPHREGRAMMRMSIVVVLISVLLSPARAEFPPNVAFQRLTIPAGDGPCGVAAGDFNGDGNLDVTFVNGNANSVATYTGDGQ